MKVAFIAYLAVGLMLGLNSTSKGRVGQIGYGGTMIAWILIWPILLIMKEF